MLDCLQHFATHEELQPDDWAYCERTRRCERSSKKLDIWSAPECLIVHLKRFAVDSTSGAVCHQSFRIVTFSSPIASVYRSFWVPFALFLFFHCFWVMTLWDFIPNFCQVTLRRSTLLFVFPSSWTCRPLWLVPGPANSIGSMPWSITRGACLLDITLRSWATIWIHFGPHASIHPIFYSFLCHLFPRYRTVPGEICVLPFQVLQSG